MGFYLVISILIYLTNAEDISFYTCCCGFGKDTFRGFKLKKVGLAKIEINAEDLFTDKLKVSDKLIKVCQDESRGMPSMTSLSRIDNKKLRVDERECESECLKEEMDLNEQLNFRIEKNLEIKAANLQKTLLILKTRRIKLVENKSRSIYLKSLPKIKLNMANPANSRKLTSSINCEISGIDGRKYSQKSVSLNFNNLYLPTAESHVKLPVLNLNKRESQLLKFNPSSFGLNKIPNLKKATHSRLASVQNNLEFNLDMIDTIGTERNDIKRQEEMIKVQESKQLDDEDSDSSLSSSNIEDIGDLTELDQIIMNYELMIHYLKDRSKKPVELILRSYQIPPYILEKMIKIFKDALLKEEKAYENFIRDNQQIKYKGGKYMSHLKTKGESFLLKFRKKI